MQYFAAKYLEHLTELRNAVNAPEPTPEHQAALERLLREHGVDVDAGRDEVERVIAALEAGQRATMRPMPRE
jgi:hypothetical protein